MKNFLTFLFLCFCFHVAISQNIPIDFETPGNGATWSWKVFENDDDPALEIIANPNPSGINSSATVAKFTALAAGMPFAGCETLHGAGIGSFTITPANAIIRITVWKSVISDVGIKLVRSDNWSLGEIKIPNTKVNEWEQIEFDFSSHMGNTYDQIVIFPDFNARQQDNIIYFDDVYGGVATTMSLDGNEASSFQLSPNPVENILHIESQAFIEDICIYSMTGRLILKKSLVKKSTFLQLQDLPKGMYILRMHIQGEKAIRKLVKR